MAFGVKLSDIEDLIDAAHTITDALVTTKHTTTDGLVTDVKDQTDKLAGESPGESSVTANWQSGTATSGDTGADLVSIGIASDRKKLHLLEVDISQLTNGATITIRLYELVNAVERKVYPPSGTTWVVGTDQDAIPVVDGTLEITGVLRVECQSDNAGDNGKAIAYKYATEDM